jgi:cobyrinic acid a,c-diamide synthase
VTGRLPGLVLAGTASGVGKTVATLAAARALEAAGHAVAPAKAGPDFIDPSHHAAALGRPSRTIDPWLSGDDGARRNYARGAAADDAAVSLVEGMMGLYDGTVSTARVAETLDLPVALVVDAAAGMESVAATALGFREYAAHAGREVDVAGVLAARCHGGRHERGVREALPDGLRYLGRVPPRSDLEIPDRHLGLHGGREAPLDDAALDAAAETVDADALLDLARPAARPDGPPPSRGAAGDARIAVARDDAFRFVYPHSLDRLHERATVVTFAPAAGDPLPDCDGVYLPGGYPELHADALAAGPALADLAARAAEGLPILGECGGMMALARTLTPADGEPREMAGVLPADVEMRDRHQALDHVELVATADGPTAAAGECLRGHEFHYSACEADPDATYAFDVERGAGIDGDRDGLLVGRTLGTYAHVHGASGAFDRLVEACARA